MATKKKPKRQASGSSVTSRKLEKVLRDLAEQRKVNDARCTLAAERSALVEEWYARIGEPSGSIEERTAAAIQTIAEVSRDLRAMTQELRESNARAAGRLSEPNKDAGT